MRKVLILSGAGALAGIINGIFGTGGGVIIFAVLTYLGAQTKNSLATANAVMLILSLVSFAVYYKEGALNADSFRHLTLFDLAFAVAGGGLGALLAVKISPKFLKNLFCLVIVFCGGRMLFA